MNYRFVICLWIILPVTLAACSRTAPSRFYTLNTLPGTHQESIHKGGADRLTIGVGPVEVAAYLDRPQIVTRISANELKLDEFHRWAEPLKDSITRVLVDNLSNLLKEEPAAVLTSQGAMTVVDYQVVVEVIRFDGRIGDGVSLTAKWSIIDVKGKKRMLDRNFQFEERIRGAGYDGLVATQSLALENLSKQIASAIKEIRK
jgi:uncharacterized lipoprotein YmbA